jgi:hypothetical protein
MKKTLMLFVCVVTVCSVATAQYRINKQTYDYHDYTYQRGDPYDVLISGVASVFIPGLGQMLSDEVGRGLFFLGGDIVCWGAAGYGLSRLNSPLWYVGCLGATAVTVLASIDAYRVAAVNNLAFRGKKELSSAFHFAPYVGVEQLQFSKSVPLGLSLQIQF